MVFSTTIGKLAESVSERFASDSYDEVVLINTSDVDRGIVTNHVPVRNENLRGQFKKAFRRGDILYSEIRPGNRRYAFIDFDPSEYVASTKLMVIRTTSADIEVRYLYHFLTSAATINFLQGMAESRSGTFPQITFDEIARMRINIPELPEQRKIVSFLDSLDAKIAVNNRTNDYLEELATLLYVEKLERQEEELPEGWTFQPLSDFFPVKTGKKDANIATDSGLYPFFTCGQKSLLTDTYSFDGSAILVAGNGDFNVKWYEGKFEAYQRTYVLMPNSPALLGFLYCAVKRNLDQITSGSRGSVIKFITKGNIADHHISVPPKPEDDETVIKLNLILKTIDAHKKEIAALENLRDTLLPKLMSGEIDVSEVEVPTSPNNHLCVG